MGNVSAIAAACSNLVYLVERARNTILACGEGIGDVHWVPPVFVFGEALDVRAGGGLECGIALRVGCVGAWVMIAVSE